MTVPLIHRMSGGSPALHYVEGPASGTTLLLLHGVTRNWRDWEALLPALTPQRRVVALDHRRHGQSERAPAAYRVIDYAHDAAEFVRDVFSEPVTVVGHSLGAMVALWVAAECVPLIRCAILEDPPFHTMGKHIAETPYQAQFAGMQHVAREGGDVETMTAALADVRIPTPQGAVRLGDLRDGESLRFSAECLTQVDPDVFTPLVAGQWLDGFDPEPLWPRVQCPVLLWQGDPAAGGLFADAEVALARDGLAKHHHVRFDGVGHQIHRTCPDAVLNSLNAFLKNFNL